MVRITIAASPRAVAFATSGSPGHRPWRDRFATIGIAGSTLAGTDAEATIDKSGSSCPRGTQASSRASVAGQRHRSAAE